MPPIQHIEQLATSDLKPYAQNARTHSAEQVEQIVRSIQEFGWTNPILIRDDLTIIAGHGRWMAAQKLEQASVPCLRLAHLTEEQARAYVIADNQIAQKAGWDFDVLSSELEALKAEGFDLPLLGFSEKELVQLLKETGEKVGESPDAFQEVGADLATDYCCPKCAYTWSGAPK